MSSPRKARRLSIAVAVALWSALSAAAHPTDCPVGVNVNSFQNFSADQQHAIVEQLEHAGVRFVRTSLRPDDKNLTLAQALQTAGIGLVLVPDVAYPPGAPLRPADPQRHIRSARPLSAADVDLSRTQFQTIFDQLDARGITLAGVELGNELNWVDFNGDFALPGQGRSFTLDDLARDPEAKRVAQGFLQYLKILAVLKDVRDHSRLNRRTPILTAGMATVGGGAWQQKFQLDGVSIPATYAFLRAHGLDQLVDGYGVHAYPQPVNVAGKGGAPRPPAPLDLLSLDEKVFPPGNTKPYWVTEWGLASHATSAADDQKRTQEVEQMRRYFLRLYQQGRLGGLFWYVWNEPDPDSVYRGGALLPAGERAIAPMPAKRP